MNEWGEFYVKETPLSYQKRRSSSSIFDIHFKLPENNPDSDEPTIQQVNAYDFLIVNSIKLKQSMLESLLSEYKNIQDIYEYPDYDKALLMPNVDTIEEFKSLLRIQNIYVLEDYKDDMSYVGFEFYCLWDEEHGLGIRTYLGEVIKIGFAEEAFTNY